MDEEFEVLVEEEYCDLCEQEGHTFRTCPQRDDEDSFEVEDHFAEDDAYDMWPIEAEGY